MAVILQKSNDNLPVWNGFNKACPAFLSVGFSPKSLKVDKKESSLVLEKNNHLDLYRSKGKRRYSQQNLKTKTGILKIFTVFGEYSVEPPIFTRIFFRRGVESLPKSNRFSPKPQGIGQSIGNQIPKGPWREGKINRTDLIFEQKQVDFKKY